MKVLVTGAAGFIGAALSRALCERGDDVVGIDNFTPYYDVQLKKDRVAWANEYDNFRFEELDLTNREGLEKLYKDVKPDRVAHLAAQAGVRYSLDNPHAYMDSNLVGFLNLIEAVRHNGTEHFVYASSSSVYGANRKMPFSTKDRTDHPISLYAATKKANEAIAHSYSHLYKIPTTGLRFFTVYGPWGRPDMAVFKFTEKIVRGDTIDVYGHGKLSRDFTYIDDIVAGVVKVVDQPAASAPQWDAQNPDTSTSEAPYRIYNIGNHTPVGLGEFIETLESVIGIKAKKNFMDMQPGDVVSTFADVHDLQKDFGFEPNTTLKDGLTLFYKWYQGYFE